MNEYSFRPLLTRIISYRKWKNIMNELLNSFRPLLTRIISYLYHFVQLQVPLKFPSPFNEDHFISERGETQEDVAKMLGFRPLLTRIISYLCLLISSVTFLC